MKDWIAGYLSHAFHKKRKSVIEHASLAAYSAYKKVKNQLIENDNAAVCKLTIRSKNLKRRIMSGKYKFVTVDELLVWTSEWIRSFPRHYDLIVGVPRSGLLVANLIALKLGKPLTTPELFVKGRYWKSDLMDTKRVYKNILLVDDSTTSGETMEEAVKLLNSACKGINVTKAALIATKDSKRLVDLCYKVIPNPRIFEWNLLHSKKGKIGSDLDGVICENCPPGIDADEEQYREWIKNAKPYLIPAFEINTILSNRLEKYRPDTEEWLAKHGVLYKQLILWDIQSKQERDAKHAQRKVEMLLKVKPDIFWESSFAEAKQIWVATKITTLCIDEMILLG